MSRRAVAPVVGVSLMLVVTVVLAALVGAFAIGLGGATENAPEAVIMADIEVVESGNKEIILTHAGGDALDVHKLTVKIFIDGEPLKYQPEVPANAGMKGFEDTPAGPFNEGNGNIWTAGEVTSLIIAGTNSPYPTAGSRVTVKFYSNGLVVATAQAVV